MENIQSFLREDQKAQLQNIAGRTGAAESELIQRGVDMLIAVEQRKARKEDWKNAWRQACGMWKDREDVEALIATQRNRLNARIDGLKQ